MYLLKFIVITLIYSWGHAFQFGQATQANFRTNKYNATRQQHMQLPTLNFKQIETLIDEMCRPSCYISVVAAQGWHNSHYYPDYQSYDPGYHSQQHQRQQKTDFNSESSRSYSALATIYQHRPQTQTEAPCECKRLKDCPSVLERFYRSQVSLSDWLLSNLPHDQCGYYPNDVVVCCPKTRAKVTVVKSTTEKPWVWEITRNVPDLQPKHKIPDQNNFEQSYERWDHTQFHKFKPATAAPPKAVQGNPQSHYNDFRYSEDDYQYNLIDFEDPDTHKNCPPSFNDEFDMPVVSKPLSGTPKRKTGIGSRKPNIASSGSRGANKPLSSRRRFPNQGTQLNQVNGQNVNQKINGRQPVKRYVNSPLCGISVNTRIVGGREIAPGQFPWMARIAYRNRTSGKLTYRCAGSVISDRFILTAAHCITNLVSSLEVFLVRLGDLDTKRNLDCELNPQTCVVPQDYYIQKLIPHEKYDSPKYANDIALIKIVRPFNAAQVTQICLPVDELANVDKKLTGKTGIIAGWGSKVAGGVKQNPSLQYVLLPIVNRSKCATAYAQFSANSRTPIIVTDSQICAQGMENMDACQGDSGGPLMIEGASTNARFTLLGLVSFGPRTCGVSNFPGVYTRVSSYINWIVANMD